MSTEVKYINPIKKQLSRLVGWGAENIQISSTLDYETTVQAFLEKAEL